MKNKKLNLGLILLLLISFLVRIYHINTLSLFGDEIDVGYQAYSLLNTGKDYKGNFFPVYIQSLSESRAPLLIYFSIPGVKLFGLTELGVRITPIFFGVLSIYLFYKLIFLLSQDHRLALISATALSFSPWHFHYSRTSFEVTLLLSLVLAGVYFFQRFIQSSKTHFIYLAIICFGFSFYTYNTANIFVPLIVLFLIFTNFKKVFSLLKPSNIIISIVLTIVFITPIGLQIFSGQASNRFKLISIFNDPKTINNLIDRRTSFSAVNPNEERFFYNKITAWGTVFVQNYFESLSPSFLFTRGDTNNVRHSVPQFGLLFIAFSLPFFIGLFHFNSKNKLHQLMLFWLIIAPIASCLTIQGEHHSTRLFLMLPALTFFIGLGLNSIFISKKIFSKLIIITLSGLFIFEVTFYSHEYFYRYPKEYFKSWNYGYKELFSSLPTNSSNKVFISNTNYNSLLPYLFYNKLKPNSLNLNDLEKPNIYQDMNGFQISQNTFFINNWHTQNIFEKIDQISQKGDLLLLFQLNEIPGDMDFSQKPISGFKTIKTIYNPNHTILGQVIQKL